MLIKKKKIKNKTKVILLGDQISDLNMVDKKIKRELINVGFYSSRTEVSIQEFKNVLDIVCEDEKDDYITLKNYYFD